MNRSCPRSRMASDMSGVVAMWNLDGQPADPRLLKRMTESVAHRGPDGDGYWIDRSVALGHRMLHTTPESLREVQPLADETGHLCLAFDGRLDNREEVAAGLRSKGAVVRTDTDAELVLRAYEAWGQACPRRLLGDFAFIIWDGRHRQLFCARDPMGCKPLLYYMDDRLFLCASELPPFFAHPLVKRTLNEGMLGEYLAGEIVSQEDTLYRGITRLPPAQTLVVQPNRVRKERYWNIDPARTITYKTDQEYAEHFRSLFEDSVRCRLRSQGPVGSYLSGGLDSSSVAAMAQSLQRDSGRGGVGIEAFSLVFPGWPCDESSYIQDVVRLWDLPSHRVTPESQDRSYFAACARQHQDFPGYPNGTMGNSLRALAQQRGCRVLLTGTGGDEWLTGSSHHAADLLRRLCIQPMLRRLGPDTGTSDLRDVARAFVHFGFAPLLPPGLRRGLKILGGHAAVPPWIEPQFARRIGLAERLLTPMDALPFPTLAQTDIYRNLQSGWWAHTAEIEERAASRFGLEERHPLSDQRIVEFTLAIPEEQRWRGPAYKFILRRAMEGLLPSSVGQRLSKAEFSPVLLRTVASLGGSRFFDSLQLSARGWLREGRAGKIYQEMMRHKATNPPPGLWPLWMIAGTELWLRHAGVEASAAAAATSRVVPAMQSA